MWSIPGISYFKNARNFRANNITFNTSNTFVSDSDALEYLHKHSATGAMHDSEERFPPPLCHPGTREVVVCRIEGWYGFQKPPEKKIMWVHGPAGYGKTAVAGTVSNKMESFPGLKFNPIAATFFFWRTSPERNSPKRFIITLAYQFTISIPELAPYIAAAVKRDPMVLNKALEVQLTRLIVEPFISLGDLDKMPHRLVIIDGLDECINSDQESRVQKQYAEDQERVQVRLLELVRILHSHHLPLCFLILSRPEPWIKQHIESRSFKSITESLDLYQAGDHLKDVEKYVRDELSRISEGLSTDGREQDEGEKWPGEELVQRFLRRTNGHILYATTVIRHIDDPYDDPRERLRRILDQWDDPDLARSTPFSSLHELYREILLSCPREHRATMVEVLEEMLILGTGFLNYRSRPPSLNYLDRISERTPGRGVKVLRPLHAVICQPDEEAHFNNGFFYHSSFADFLGAESSVLPELNINFQKGVRRMLLGCLKGLLVVDIDPKMDFQDSFCLNGWPSLWHRWKPEEDSEPSSLVQVLLRVDLTAHFVQAMEGKILLFKGFLLILSNLYHPTDNLITHGKRDSVCISLLETSLAHVRSSVEGAFLRMLEPDFYGTELLEKKDYPSLGLTICAGPFLRSLSEHHPPFFDLFIRALKTFLEKQEELFGKLEKALLDDGTLCHSKSAVASVFKLARQVDNT